MNKVILIGNLTHDPEYKKISDDKEVCKLRLAINGYKKDDVIYVDVDAWGKLASLCSEYLVKGRKVGVDGRLALSQWETESGERRQKLFVIADQVEFLSPKGENGGSEPAKSKSEKPAAPVNNQDWDDDENIPF